MFHFLTDDVMISDFLFPQDRDLAIAVTRYFAFLVTYGSDPP